jgi:Fur family ferric uptake transcriptional regulator
MDRRRVTLARLERARDDIPEIRKPNPLERRCIERGVRLSAQRRVILQALAEAADHLSAGEIHARVGLHGISIPTVYRMLNSLTDAGVMKRHGFGNQAAKFEVVHPSNHDHLIDVDTGQIVELTDSELANLLEEAAANLGYRLVSYRLRLFGAPKPAKA